MAYCDYEWNGLGYVKLSLFYPHYNNERYAKVRAYRTEGSTMVYGPWSTPQRYDVPNFYDKRSGGAQYSYEVFLVKNKRSGLYDGITSVLYVKTDNPNSSSFKFVKDGDSFFKNHVMSSYNDIEYLTNSDSDSFFRKVKGGYVANLEIDEPGTYQVELQEANSDGYVVAKTVTFTVKDYEKAAYAWIDDLIAKATTASMNPMEKMEAVVGHILTEGGFRYVTMRGDRLVFLAAQPNSPWFETLRWDSFTSPAALCTIANRIGGFDEVHNCYGDYPRGSSEWYMYHAMARVTYNGETRYFEVCPSSSTGDVGNYSMIDFGNSANLVKIG